MTGSLPYAIAGILVLIAVAAYHGVTEHYWHLHYFWRYVRPGIVIPPTRHDTRWHGTSHTTRWAYNTGMIVVAGFLGTGWRLEPKVTTYAVAALTVIAVVWLGARTVSRTFGERHRYPDMREED